MSSSDTRSDSASPSKDKSLLAQVESYIKRLMKGIPVILRVEHDDGDSNDEPVTKSAICTGILNRNLESVKFTPLKDEESTDVSKDPGIVIELQDVEKVVCLNENHPSVVLVIPKYDRYVEIVSSGVEDFKAWYATLHMLCPGETEDDSSITDDSQDASSDNYDASSPELSAKARRAMMEVLLSVSPASEDSPSRGSEEHQVAQVNALKQIISSQGRLIDALRRDRDRMQILEMQNRDLVRVLKEREISLDELMGVCQRLMDQQGKWVNIHLVRNTAVLKPSKPASASRDPFALPAVPHVSESEKNESKRPVFAPKLRKESMGEDSGSDDDSSGVDVADLDNSELDILVSYLDDKLMLLKRIEKEIDAGSPEDEDSDEEDARVDATLENVVAEEAEITKLQDELQSLQKEKVARVLDSTALSNMVRGHE